MAFQEKFYGSPHMENICQGKKKKKAMSYDKIFIELTFFSYNKQTVIHFNPSKQKEIKKNNKHNNPKQQKHWWLNSSSPSQIK